MFRKYKEIVGVFAMLLLFGFFLSIDGAGAQTTILGNTLMPMAVTGPDTTTISSSNGTFTIRTDSANCIYTEFMPNESVDCDSIVFVQTCKIKFWDGSKWKAYKPGDVYSGWWYRDGDTTSDSTFVDHVFCEKDPNYNGDDPQDIGNKGSGGPSGGGSYILRAPLAGETPATMHDCPNMPDACFPSGTTKCKMEFEVAAICADDGKVLGSFKWEYNRDKGASGRGTDSVLTTGSAPDTVSSGFTTARDTFIANHKDSTGATYCPEKRIADIIKQILDIFTTALGSMPASPLPGELVTAYFTVENTGETELVDIPVGLTLNGFLMEERVIPILMPEETHDIEFMFIAENGVNSVKCIADFYGDNEESDEHNNAAKQIIYANNPSAVPLFSQTALVILVLASLLTAVFVLRRYANGS